MVFQLPEGKGYIRPCRESRSHHVLDNTHYPSATNHNLQTPNSAMENNRKISLTQLTPRKPNLAGGCIGTVRTENATSVRKSNCIHATLKQCLGFEYGQDFPLIAPTILWGICPIEPPASFPCLPTQRNLIGWELN